MAGIGSLKQILVIQIQSLKSSKITKEDSLRVQQQVKFDDEKEEGKN